MFKDMGRPKNILAASIVDESSIAMSAPPVGRAL
jgi:hypothetical protein